MTQTFSGPTVQFSNAARQRMMGLRGEPFFLNRWTRAAFIHFEIDPEILQREVPFELDLYGGKAFVSLVAFDLEKMRPRLGGMFTEFLMKPVATHGFLNVRTYVRRGNETGIYFLAEYLPNKLGLLLGPALYGLPYRSGKLDYHHRPETGKIFGNIWSGKKVFEYRLVLNRDCDFQPSETDSLDEFLLERYSAFTFRNGTSRVFHIWHPPWRQARGEVEILKADLFSSSEWFQHGRLCGGHYSPGFDNVWMGRPRTL